MPFIRDRGLREDGAVTYRRFERITSGSLFRATILTKFSMVRLEHLNPIVPNPWESVSRQAPRNFPAS